MDAPAPTSGCVGHHWSPSPRGRGSPLPDAPPSGPIVDRSGSGAFFLRRLSRRAARSTVCIRLRRWVDRRAVDRRRTFVLSAAQRLIWEGGWAPSPAQRVYCQRSLGRASSMADSPSRRVDQPFGRVSGAPQTGRELRITRPAGRSPGCSASRPAPRVDGLPPSGSPPGGSPPGGSPPSGSPPGGSPPSGSPPSGSMVSRPAGRWLPAERRVPAGAVARGRLARHDSHLP